MASHIRFRFSAGRHRFGTMSCTPVEIDSIE
jgi:hypothetical protein